MLNKLIHNLVLPLIGRGGTALATVLVGYGVQADLAGQIGAGVGALALIGVDLFSDWVGRRNVADKAFVQAVNTMVHGDKA